MLIHDDFSKKCHAVFKLLSMCAKFQINKQQLSIQKNISLPLPLGDYNLNTCKQVSGQNTSAGIGIVELTDPSDT